MKRKLLLSTIAISALMLAATSANAISTKVTTATNAAEASDSLQQTQQGTVVDEVIWVVGEEPILRSDVETMRLRAETEGIKYKGNPDCAIPEQIAVQKLFLHQAAIDSIEVTESEIASGIDEQINHWIELAGSKEKLEEYHKKTISQLRQQMHDDFKDQELIRKMRMELVKDISVTPSDVRNYYNSLSEDSIPFVPTEVEVQIITRQPRPTQEELNKVKDDLRSYTDRVNKGDATFAMLARLYSEDPGTARQGGEVGFMGRGQLDPAFASVAFNLTDPKKISKIVESEFGFHIIQLIDKRGDKINCRHILRKPRVSEDKIAELTLKLDSLADEIRKGDYTFEVAASHVSDDKDTRNNNGLMSNRTYDSMSSHFKMRDLPTEVARAVEGLKVGEISKAFTMINSKGKTQVAIVKLKSLREGHKATITDDFQLLKEIVLENERERTIHDWVVQKIKKTYVKMKDEYKNCEFEYEGWVK